jgi:hypothetical protein
MLSSYVDFNVTTGDLTAGFSSVDVEALKAEFTDGNDIAIKFQVFVIIPGSSTQGTGTTLTDLVSA